MTSTSLPPGACDCHVHVFGPYDRFPLPERRTYTPPEATVADLRTLHAGLGIERVVLVQPSPYADDNSCLVATLGQLGPAGRGVAVIDPQAPPALADLHAAGVRGVRVNLHSHGVSDPRAAADQLLGTADLVAGLGWHVQVFATIDLLTALGDDLGRLPAPLVVDHFGFADPDAGVGAPGFGLLCELLRAGRTWVKISAPERLPGDPDRPAIAELARGLLAANADRVVWGSDWPHTRGSTGHDPHTPQPFGEVDDVRGLRRLREWVADDAAFAAVLAGNPARLYDF